MLTVAVLGPVEVRRDGRRLQVPTGRTTELLVRLALDPGRPVRSELIIEDLWGAAAGRTGKNTLQSKVSQLRRALADPASITSGVGGYTLRLDGSRVDAVRVPELSAAAAAARRSGDPETARDLAAEGLALYRGEVLGDAGDGDWLHPHRVRLHEVRLALVEDHLAAQVALGAGADVIGELQALVAQHPLREDLWLSLVTALYRAGRQADALAAYARVRRTLVAELGVEPGPALRALEGRVLRQSTTLDPRTAPAVPPPRVGNLPALSSTLVGRADDLTTLRRLLADQRLVTLVGPAGVGKTRLALEVARHVDVPGGVWLVRLDTADAATSVARVVAETLHLAGGEPMLFERVAAVATVLVLDNCEHVIDAVADLTVRLLDAAAGLRVLATSQLPLGLDGEAAYPLEPLPLADSVALFARRAAQTRTRFVFDDDTAATVELVCRSLDGLPLAIELAAARVRSLSVREISRRLDDRFALLRDPTSRRPERHRALAAALAWSYDLLHPDDQRGLWALSCFAGGASLPAAEHVLGALGVPAASVVDTIGRLADRSLVNVEIVGGSVRYRLLESIRAFALDRLRDTDLYDRAREAHAYFFAESADRCAATVRGPAQSGCLALARTERADIDAALAWAAGHDPRLGVRIANGFGWTWVVLGDGVDAAGRIRGALTAAGELATPREQASGLLLAGWLEASAGNVAQAQIDLDRALHLAHLVSDARLGADARRHLAFLRIQQGRPLDVLDLTAASIAVYRAEDLRWETAAGLLLAAYGSTMLRDTAGAARSAEEAVHLLTTIDDAWGLVHADASLGAVAHADHRLDDAARSLTRAAATAERLGFLGQAALHLTTLGRVVQRAGDTDAAVAALHRAIEVATTSGDLRIIATARIHLARTLYARGDHHGARELLEAADRWYRIAGGGDGALLARCLLASMSGTDDGARHLRDVLAEALGTDDRQVHVLATDALARLAAERGRLDTARTLLHRADGLALNSRDLLDDADRIDAHRARRLVSTE